MDEPHDPGDPGDPGGPDGPDDYELLDAGDGRRLERFGARVVDRPAPAATGPRSRDASWDTADLRFDRHRGWRGAAVALDPWTVRMDALTLELRSTETGQVGLFPEQRPVWQWLTDRVAEVTGDPDEPPPLLNLFGYTGAATLAAAAAGGNVVHVDASRPGVAWARRNAELSGLADAPIRWLVDDAESFLRREARRRRRYAGLVLDPPSYGHGPSGKAWRLQERLHDLVGLAADVATPDAFVALSAHTPGIGPDELQAALAWAFGQSPSLGAGPLELEARSGARLPLGSWACIMAGG